MRTGSAQWQHELRNAANGALLSVTVARRLLAQGQQAQAAGFLDDAQAACERLQQLLEPPSGDTTGAAADIV